MNDFTLDSYETWMPEMEKYNDVLAGYFKLLYKIFGLVILAFFQFGKLYQDVEIEPFAEPEYLPEIIRKLFIYCIHCLIGYPVREVLDENTDSIIKQLPKLRTCAEANEFAAIVEEMLLWVKSELDGSRDREYRNIYTGMLIETSNSNIFYLWIVEYGVGKRQRDDL